MATVTRIGTTGQYVMSYEVCGSNYNCQVHIKPSSDGDTWGSGSTDLGTAPETTDGRELYNSPVITWDPERWCRWGTSALGHERGAPRRRRP